MQPKSDLTIENWLQLEPLILALKTSGFVVTPSTYIQFKELTESYPVQKLRENNYALLGDLLCPIVTQNKEQQQRFKIVFENYLTTQRAINFPEKSDKQNYFESVLNFVKRHKIRTIVVVLLLAVACYFLYPPKDTIIPIGNYTGDTLIQLNDSIEYNGESFLPDSFTHADKFSFQWDFGDNCKPDPVTNTKHLYASKGNFNLTVHVKSQEYNVDTTVSAALTVVKGIPRVQIQTRRDLTNLKKGDAARFAVKLTDKRKVVTSTTWTINDSVVSSSLAPLTYLFNDTGFYRVRFTAIVDSLNGLATQHGEESFYVGDNSNAAQVTVLPSGKAIEQTYQFNRNWITGILITLMFLFILYQTINTELKEAVANLNKLQQKIKDAIEAAIAARLKKVNIPYEYQNTKPPLDISFADQEHLVNYSPEFDKLVQLLRNRVHDESNVLQVSKTIQATVRKGGFIDLVYDPKSKPREYLILVDKQFTNSQQTKLFNNLANYYSDANVFSEKFLFNIDLDNIYHENDKVHLIPLADLKRKFPEHITIIISDGYGLLDETESLPHDSVLYQWQKVVVLTPIPLSDWGYREKALQQKFLLLPVDVQGQTVLLDAIETLNFKADKQLIPDANSYSVKYVDFSDETEIEEYLNTEQDGDMLFQWLCCIAIYPKIKWEVILAVGYALFSHHNKLHLLSFDNLLKLTRIPWLHEGKYSGYMRYDLLKKLTRENEFIARTAIIELLNRSSAPKDSFAYEEWDVQKKTNEAILFASDQLRYAGYEQSFIAMKKLWSNKLITDLHLVKSLSEETISSYRNNVDSNSRNVESVTMAQFFTQDAESVNEDERQKIKNEIELQHEKERIKLESDRRRFAIGKNIAIVLFIFVLASSSALFLFKNNLKGAALNAYLHAVIPENKIKTDITFQPSFDSCFVNTYLGNSSYKMYLIINNKDTFSASPGKDYIRFTGITMDSLNASAALFFDAKKNIASSEFNIFTDSFSFNATSCVTSPITIIAHDTVFINYSNNRDKETINITRKYLQQRGYIVMAPYWRSDFKSVSEVRYSDISKNQKADSLASVLSGLVTIDTTILNNDVTSHYPLELWINNNEMSITEQCEEVDNAEVTKFDGMWRDNNNRVTRFYSQGNQIYYSTGDVKSYSTYYTVRVCKADSTFIRFITRAKYGYKVFFVNILSTRMGSTGATRPRLQMRLCDAVQAASEEEAEKITANQCPAVSTLNRVSDMGMAQNQIVYDYDKRKYASFEQRKLDSIVTILKKDPANQVLLSAFIALRGNNASSTNAAQKGMQQIQSYLFSKGAGKTQVVISYSVNVLPFNRDYILYKLREGFTDASIKKPINNINIPPTSTENPTKEPPKDTNKGTKQETQQGAKQDVDLTPWRKQYEEINADVKTVLNARQADKKLLNKYNAKSEEDFKNNVTGRLEKIQAGVENAFEKKNVSATNLADGKNLVNKIKNLISDLSPKQNNKKY